MAKTKRPQPTYNLVISWSGDRSKTVALAFHRWLPTVLQSAKPWMSDTDIAKGAAWQGELGRQLDACKVAVMFLTPENVTANWLHFEAGALSKPIRKGRVSTVLLGDLKPANVPGPLGIFQHTSPTKDDLRKLVLSIADAIDADVQKDALRASFDNGWAQIEGALKLENRSMGAEHRSDRQLLEALIEETREIRRELAVQRLDEGGASEPYVRDLLPVPDWILRAASSDKPNGRVDPARLKNYLELRGELQKSIHEFDRLHTENLRARSDKETSRSESKKR